MKIPFFHLVMDIILVVMLIVPTVRWLKYVGEPVFNNPHVTFVFDGRSPQDIGPTSLLITGTLPAGVISTLTVLTTRKHLDIPYGCVIWFVLFEGIAMPLWFFAARNPAMYKWCVTSICVRILAGLTVASKLWCLGAGMQVLFWFSAMIYVFVLGVRVGINAFTKRASAGLL